MTFDSPIPSFCQVCLATEHEKHIVPMAIIRPAIMSEIQSAHPELDRSGYICTDDLNRFRQRYLESVLGIDEAELDNNEREVLEAFGAEKILTEDVEFELEQSMTFGEHLSDQIASFGGSWRFIIAFFIFIAIWVLINSVVLFWRPYDPYPFILLNLFLSLLASIQAPILMMSQNRQEAKDRVRSENDYRTNLKAELEIRMLNEKMDHLQAVQWKRLIEIQQIQLEIINELHKKQT